MSDLFTYIQMKCLSCATYACVAAPLQERYVQEKMLMHS